MVEKARVLIVAHGHPDIDRGGGEVAAYAQHQLLRHTDPFTAVFFARQDEPWPIHPGTVFSGTGRPGEILMHSRTSDRYLFRQDDERRVWREFREVLDTVRPDIVHFHHYLHLGIEMLAETRRWSATVPILLTLHDFHAICHNDGLMVRTRDGSLCHAASSSACSQCFRDRGEQDFTLRERYIKAFFDHVDRFVAPSRFLANRYIDWGLAAERIEVLENLLPPVPHGLPDGVPDSDPASQRLHGKLRLAVFGRLSEMKGTPLLLDALQHLPRATLNQLQVDIHGTGMKRMARNTRRGVRRSVKRLGPSVRLHGGYRQDAMRQLLDGVDWMIVPSRWWENSPMVILEAKRNGVPMIVADIGGMAEKVVDGDTGLHFRAGDAFSLAATIERAVALGRQRTRMAENAARDWQPDAVAKAHLALHASARELGERRRASGPSGQAGSPTRLADAA